MRDTHDAPTCPYPPDLPSRTSASQEIGGRRYPSRADYASGLPADFDVADLADELLERVQRHWHASGQNGCAFAQWIAKRAGPSEWAFIVSRGQPGWASAISESVHFAAERSPAELLSILFPEVVSTDEALRILDSLGAEPGFSWELHETVVGYETRMLRYVLPSSPVVAWVMAFGPFEWMPATRRAPIFELTLRVKPKPDVMYHRLNQDSSVAHLADYPAPLRAGAWDRLFEFTLRETRRILGREPDPVSAAKMTVAVPVAATATSC